MQFDKIPSAPITFQQGAIPPTGSNPTAMLKTPPIPYFSASRKLPHMGRFWQSQKGEELEFSPIQMAEESQFLRDCA